MPLVIDTFNVLHTTGVLPAESAGIDVDDLIGLLEISRYRRHRITLVCDGSGRDRDEPGICGGVAIRYSGRGRPADEIIIGLINRTTSPRQLLVITSDQEIVRAAKRRRCPTLKSQGFLKQLANDIHAAERRPRREKRQVDPIPREDVRHWIDAFGLKEHELKTPASMLPAEPAPPPPSQAKQSPKKTSEPPPKEKKKPVDQTLPGDVIHEAETLWRARPRRRKPTTQPDAPPEKDKRSSSADGVFRKMEGDGRPKRDIKKLRDTRVDRMSEEEAETIDLTELMADVEPLDGDDDDA